MKNIFWILIIGLLISNEIGAQENINVGPAQKAYDLSYAYGAQMAMTLEKIGLTAEEKDADKFVEGFKAGLTIDSASFADAQNILERRMSSKKPSKTVKQAKNIAYSMGLSSIGGLALEVEILSTDFDLDALKEGFSDGISGKVSKMSQEKMDNILKDYFLPKSDEYREKMEAKQKVIAEKTLEEGISFLAENKNKPGVITTASGLQYQIIRKGKGPNAKPSDRVKTHYHGTLINGTIFDSSVDRKEPASFPLDGVIKGWQEGVVLMNKGSKYRFFIPQELGYGMESPTASIPAGSVLIFEVELLEIYPK